MGILIIVCSVLSSLIACVLACVPGLHIYNFMALAAVVLHLLGAQGISLSGEVIISCAVGMTVAYSLLSNVPSVLVSAPDESSLFTVLPGQKFLMKGRGYEAVIVTASGGVLGLFVLLCIGPFLARKLPMIYEVLRPHSHWILWCVICFMLMSEWPKGITVGQGGWERFFRGWRSISMGLVTFVLSGLLGFILMYRSPVSSKVAFQNLMPALVGLFALPWLILNLASSAVIPDQRFGYELSADELARGGLAGTLGGGFAAFFPVVTGGVGGLLSGHALAARNDRVFLVSQGASKVVYYVGGLLLFFVPLLNITRGGGAWTVGGLYVPKGCGDFYVSMSAAAIAGAAAVIMIHPLTKFAIVLLEKHGYKRMSFISLITALLIVVVLTGWSGIFVSIVALGIGLLPVVFGSRRMNCLGIILLPMACNMSGFGDSIARLLGLL